MNVLLALFFCFLSPLRSISLNNTIIVVLQPYLHESRHLHALKRARGSGGRFLNAKKLTSANHGDSITTCSDVFQQHESDFRLCGYPSHIGRNMQGYSADIGGGGGGGNQHRLSVLM